MNNEPVAWMVKAPDGEYLVFEKSEHPVMADCTYIPLYTHPAKTLTDEEIEGIARANVDGHTSMEQLKWFAKAILRKAQKK
jgi:hypothetical protein